MSDAAPRRSMPSVTGADAYSDLLVRTRGMQREQRAARDDWFQQLGLLRESAKPPGTDPPAPDRRAGLS